MRKTFYIIAAALLIASCHKGVRRTINTPPPVTDNCKGERQGTPCPEVWDPVCGCDGVTYGNECSAKSEGVKKWTKGECK